MQLLPSLLALAHFFLTGCSFDLQPVASATSGVLRSNPLGNHAFQVPLLQLREQRETITDDVISKPDSVVLGVA